MKSPMAYSAQGSGIDLDRARELLGTTTQTEYANTTVFVETPSVNPMAVRLQQMLAQPATPVSVLDVAELSRQGSR